MKRSVYITRFFSDFFRVRFSDTLPHEGEVFAGWALNDDEENLYESGTEIKTNKADNDYTMKFKAVYKEETNPTAVLYNDGTLIFYEDDPDPADETEHSGIMTDPWTESSLCIYPGLDSWATETFKSNVDCPWTSGRHLSDITTVQFKGIVKPKSTAFWFSSCNHLETFIPDGLDTSNVTSMQSMFERCSKLQTVSLESFDTSQVQDMAYMFNYCDKLTNVDGLDTWDTGNVMYIDHMFFDCEKIAELNLSDWDVSNVTNMSCIFYDCFCLQKLNLSNWYPEKIEKISQAFQAINRDGDTPAKIYAQDWTSIQYINKVYLFDGANVPNYNSRNTKGDMCKPQSMGGYFTDPI